MEELAVRSYDRPLTADLACITGSFLIFQYHDTAEQRLAVAVLEQTFEDIEDWGRKFHLPSRRAMVERITGWVEGAEARWSFADCCGILGLDSEWAAFSIMHKIAETQAAIEAKKRVILSLRKENNVAKIARRADVCPGAVKSIIAQRLT